MAVPGGNKSIAPDETNIVTSKNWGKQIMSAVKAARGCGNDVGLLKLKKQKTTEVDEAAVNVPTHSIQQNFKDQWSGSNERRTHTLDGYMGEARQIE